MTEHQRLLALSAQFREMAQRAIDKAQISPDREKLFGMCGMAGAFEVASAHCIKIAGEIAPHATN